MTNTKHRFEMKVVAIEDDRVQVIIYSGSDKGKPIAKGIFTKLDSAAKTAFIEAIRQLDGGKIVQVSQMG